MAGIGMKKYTFEVASDANKIEIAKAVEELFTWHKVAKVNTMNVAVGHAPWVEPRATLLPGRRPSLLSPRDPRQSSSSKAMM